MSRSSHITRRLTVDARRSSVPPQPVLVTRPTLQAVRTVCSASGYRYCLFKRVVRSSDKSGCGNDRPVKSCPSSGAFPITVRSFLPYLSIGFPLNPFWSRFFRSIALECTSNWRQNLGENELGEINLMPAAGIYHQSIMFVRNNEY